MWNIVHHLLCCSIEQCISGFHGARLHFRGQESGSVFIAAVFKIQASKCYMESLPSVLNNKWSCISQFESEWSTVQLHLIIVFEIGRLIDIWKPSTLYVEYRMGGFCLYCKWNGVAWKGVCRVAAEMFAFASLQKEKRRKKWMTLTLADHRVWSPSPAATIGGWTSLLTALQVTLSSTSAIALRQEAWD